MAEGETPETKEQRLWIETNKEWLYEHHAYPQVTTTEKEADRILYFLFHLCEDIKRPSSLVRAALAMGAEIIEEG